MPIKFLLAATVSFGTLGLRPDSSNKAPEFREMLEVLKFTIVASNKFWRCIYANGMFLSREAAAECVREGWRILEPWL